jgi:subtilisin
MTSDDVKLTSSKTTPKDGSAEEPQRVAASASKPGPKPTGGNATEIQTRRNQYLITTRQRAGLHTMQATNATVTVLESMQDVKLVKRLKPSGISLLSTMGGIGEVLVVEATAQKGLELQRTANQDLIVEPNHYLMHLRSTPRISDSQPIFPTATTGPGVPVQIQVLSVDEKPLQNTEVMAFMGAGNQTGTTDSNGLVTLTIFGGTPEAIAALYVKPFADYWERWIVNPALDSEKTNTVLLQPLTSFGAAGFPGPGKPFIGWGQKLMGLDEIPADQAMSGKGIKVAIIDSGCDHSHPALTHITAGLDLTGGNNPFLDTMGHGTHCAGIIAGNGKDGIRGFVPGAEIHILKLFPGGQFDDLISALAYCVENQIDVVNCSLGSDQLSESVQQRIDHARQAGVAVVVAAGNSSGPVQFPALLPSVLAVSAIGEEGEFPLDTYHAQTVTANPPPNGNGLFVANFSSNGPQIRVCGPGVAVISTVPQAGYAAWDGTSMATPHLTGLAALLLATDPILSQAPRTAARVDQLFQRLTAMARDLGFPSIYEGAGLPSVSPSIAQSRGRYNGVQAASQSQNFDASGLPDLVSRVTKEVLSVVIRDLIAKGATREPGPVGPSYHA